MINWIKKIFKKKEEFTPVNISPNNWSVCPTSGRVIFKIPVGKCSKKEAEKQLRKLISQYQTHYWFPTKAEKIERILNKIQPKDENYL